jgi:hypothetical protein
MRTMRENTNDESYDCFSVVGEIQEWKQVFFPVRKKGSGAQKDSKITYTARRTLYHEVKYLQAATGMVVDRR